MSEFGKKQVVVKRIVSFGEVSMDYINIFFSYIQSLRDEVDKF